MANESTYKKTHTEKGKSYEVEVTFTQISDEALERYVDKLIEIINTKEAE